MGLFDRLIEYVNNANVSTAKKSVDEIAKEVIAGKWGNGDNRKKKLKKAGYNYNAVQKKVNELLSKKSVEEIAKEVIAGKWGNGDDRKKKLEKAGYDYNAVQKKVNELLSEKTVNKPTTPTTPTTPTVKTNGQKIGEKANEFAYSTNTKSAKYSSGSPKAEYKTGLNKAYPDRSKWGTAPKKGASCDVFVGTCVRCAGVDSSFPRGLDEQIKYLAKSSKFKLVSVTTKTVQNGDIIVYSKKSGGGHICIVYGGKIKEAGYKNYYPKTTNYLSSRLSKSGKKWLKVYRAK